MIRTIRTYDSLRTLTQSWAQGGGGFILVVGPGGTGKSRTIKAAAGEDATVIEGQMSALGLYEHAYYANGGPIVIDDIDGLYSDERKVMLLKCLCQTESTRRVAWHSAGKYLDEKGIPHEFFTDSPVCIITNEWRAPNRNIKALQTRAITINFEPTPSAIHEEAGRWFPDREIYDYIANLIPLVAEHDLRSYVVSKRLKEYGDDWKQAIQETMAIDPKIVLAIEILQDPLLKTRVMQEAAFEKNGGGSRATFHRTLQKLRRAT